MTITVRRSGSNVAASVKVRRSGSWVSPSGGVFVRRSNAWVRVDATPLSASLSWNGASTVNVNGASGTAASYNSGGTFYPNILNADYSGGTGSLTASWSTNNPKVFAANSGDGTHTTVGYSGLNLGDTVTATITLTVTDSVGNTKTASTTVKLFRIS